MRMTSWDAQLRVHARHAVPMLPSCPPSQRLCPSHGKSSSLPGARGEEAHESMAELQRRALDWQGRHGNTHCVCSRDSSCSLGLMVCDGENLPLLKVWGPGLSCSFSYAVNKIRTDTELFYLCVCVRLCLCRPFPS